MSSKGKYVRTISENDKTAKVVQSYELKYGIKERGKNEAIEVVSIYFIMN